MPYDSKQNRNNLINSDNKVMGGSWDRDWGMSEKGKGIKKYKLSERVIGMWSTV